MSARLRKLTVATTFGVFPPRGGGQQRIWGLYSELARAGVEVEIVALVDSGAPGGVRRRAERIVEVRVPKSPGHDDAEHALHRAAGVPVTDIALTLLHERTPAYGEALARSARDATAVVASHPFAQPAIEAHCAAPLIYEAHNVEADLKGGMLQLPELVAAVRDVEGACCREASQVTVCSQADGARLRELYGVDGERMVVVPNGVDATAISFTGPDLRAERKRRLGLDATHLALFIGSWHEPNVVAARDVLEAARRLPDVRFLIVGGVGIPLADDPIPANVDLCGVVEGGFIASVLGLADVALNPMRSGSGTNLKMLDYLLAGVPVIASPVGARGLELEPGGHYLAAEPDGLADAIEALRAEPPAVTAERVAAAHAAVRDRYAWPVIARRWLEAPQWEAVVSGAVRA